MKREQKGEAFRSLLAILCSMILLPGDTLAYQSPQSSSPRHTKRHPAAESAIASSDRSLFTPIQAVRDLAPLE